MKQSVYDLAFNFIEEFFGEKECSSEIQRDIIDFINDLLYDEFTDSEIVQRWLDFKKQHPGRIPKLEKLYAQPPREKNLLKPNIFYYHNSLQLTCPPPLRELDYNTGEITKFDMPYFLEMRASLTLDELITYYQTHTGIDGVWNNKRLVGSFHWLLKTYEPEILLFMIDVAVDYAISEDLGRIDPLKLVDYYAMAEANRTAKVTEIRQAGDEKVVLRKRILSSRRRRQETEREVYS